MTNKVLNKSKDIGMSEYFVAFIKIIWCPDNTTELEISEIKALREVFKLATKMLSKINNNSDMFSARIPKSRIIKMKGFTDFLIFCVESTNQKEKQQANFEFFLAFLAIFQYYATIENNCMLKGAIASGPFYYSEIFVYGKALTSAYSMENSYSYYPRILLEPKTLKDFNSTKFNNLISIDRDGSHYLNYCRIGELMEEEYLPNYVKEIRNHIKRKELLNICNFDYKIQQMSSWSLSYLKEYLTSIEVIIED